jgi:hypothetical protein
MYPPNVLKRIVLLSTKTVIFILPFLFLSFPAQAQVTGTINRVAPFTTRINIPSTVPSGSCPSAVSPGQLPNHVTICGVVKTAGLNRTAGIDYAQEPIKGVTVAIYLGAKYAQGIPSYANYVKADLNSTGEIAGKIDGLYTYNITNTDGRFIISTPRGVGTNGMAFLAFFCGDKLRDLYMIDTSKGIGFMPVSLACGPVVTPKNAPNTNNIPAPLQFHT